MYNLILPSLWPILYENVKIPEMAWQAGYCDREITYSKYRVTNTTRILTVTPVTIIHIGQRPQDAKVMYR